MCGLVKGAFIQSKGSYGFDVIDLLIGFDQAESVMQVNGCWQLVTCWNILVQTVAVTVFDYLRTY